VRPARLATVQSLDSVHVTIDQGLEGDRYSGRSRKRHVTLIQHEHLAAIASLLHKQNVDPGVLWRNISISGMLTLIDV
jgi:MOSC domain-containing protein YiiM